jgi:hypothetical protein
LLDFAGEFARHMAVEIIASVSWSDDRDGSLNDESELDSLLDAGYSRTDATAIMIERITAEARDAAKVVLVEGLSDRIALEVLAERQGS